MQILALACAACGQATTELATQGPFGLHRGMTKAEIIQLVGRDAVMVETPARLALTRVPKPHSSFEVYWLEFGPKGLLRILAISKTIETNGHGKEVKRAFLELKKPLEKKYGTSETLDSLSSGSLWTAQQHWMMGFLQKDRELASLWLPENYRNLPNGITLIQLTVSVQSASEGLLSLMYEFEGWKAYSASLKAKEATVF